MGGRIILPGGMYRCCAAFLASMPEETKDEEGARVSCPLCKAPLICVEDGDSGLAWAWDNRGETK